MFRRDRLGRRGGGVILYVKESIQAYEIKLESEADYDEAVWCKIVSGNSKLTIVLTRFNKICHPSQRPRWQVDKEAIGLSRVQQCSSTYSPPS